MIDSATTSSSPESSRGQASRKAQQGSRRKAQASKQPVQQQGRPTTVETGVRPAATVEVANLIAESIQDGGSEYWKNAAHRTSWLTEIQNVYRRMGRMTLDQLYSAHSSIADGAFRQARQSSLTRCLLMVVISERRRGAPQTRASPSCSETTSSDERLRRYLAGTGRLFIDLANRLSERHGIKAYNAYTALFCMSTSFKCTQR